MKDYITLSNDYFEILIPKDLKEFGNDVLEFSTGKIKEYLAFFKEKSYGKKVKGAFLVTREDFLARIMEVRDKEDHMPPSWARGCFYGGETQILTSKENPRDDFYVLVHETFHLLFSKFVYEKNDWNRFMWLDESLACQFDTTTERLIDKGAFKKLVEKYKDVPTLPVMSDFSFKDGLFKTDKWNGYELFKIIGRYLIETMDKDELLKYINDYDRIKKDGKVILKNSIEYFVKKYNLK